MTRGDEDADATRFQHARRRIVAARHVFSKSPTFRNHLLPRDTFLRNGSQHVEHCCTISGPRCRRQWVTPNAQCSTRVVQVRKPLRKAAQTGICA
jgi:hypothetical protein